MNSEILAAAALVGTILVSAVFALWPVFSKDPVPDPDNDRWQPTLGEKSKWHTEISTKAWNRIGLLALAFAIGSPLLVYTGLEDKGDVWRVFASCLAAGLVSVVLAWSWTDFLVRKVDRRILRFATQITAITGTAYLITHWDKFTAIAAVAMILLGMFVYTFVRTIGASDARALILIGTGVVPIVGMSGFILSMYGVAFLFILFGATMIMIKKSINPEVSFPAVPMLLFPFVGILTFSSYMGFAPGFIV